MRYPASEKLEIIRIVEQSHLPAKRTLDQLGVARVSTRRDSEAIVASVGFSASRRCCVSAASSRS
tara:strand:+ start:319 stop:513 length:195 start_codon:yes stop_codon:yes gene_type:complete